MVLIETSDFGAIQPVDTPWVEGDLVANQFQVRALLGNGGMSTVWDAYDRLLHRPIALKTTHDRHRSAPVLTREARALAVARHRGLPVPYSVGTHRGWTYLAFERLFGVTLEQRLAEQIRDKRAPLAIDECVAILAEIAEVLAKVHALGMAHHDVKPGNVMLCSDGRVMLLDLGIMIAEVDTEGAEDSGTPRYLAPEAFTGTIVRGQAWLLDVYAFGVMAFEVVAGCPPFRADSFTSLVRMHLTATPPDVREVRPSAPPSLAAAIAACLAKAPADRPASMESVLWDLRALTKRAT